MSATAKKNQDKKGRSLRIPRSPGSIQTYEAIKRLIISGELRPGSDLEETELIKRFGVSRTPVRESFIRLSVEGLVTILPNRGAKVANLDLSNITDHLEVMDILTPSVCYLAALRRTKEDLKAIKHQIEQLSSVNRDEVDERLEAIFELYTLLGKATQNESLSNVYKLTIYAKLRIGRVSGARSETDTEWQDHVIQLRELYNDIYNSIEARDATKAQSAARELLSAIRVRLSSIISTSDVPTNELQLG
jgi:DNA-binding GntR family transcriptional regulator